MIDQDDLPEEIGGILTLPNSVEIPVADKTWSIDASRGLRELVGKPLTEIEHIFILETLQSVAGNREEAAQILGIGERTLYRKIKEYGI
jgi:two-component system response regulator HydG